jgi:uncharacterized MAPEG superfamily protein
MALFCIVFSSASKRLIELRIDQHFNYAATATIGKKIKGCRDKRDFFRTSIQSTSQQADNNSPEFFFFLSAFIAIALLYFFEGDLSKRIFKAQVLAPGSVRPLYLHNRRLQV